MTTPRKKQNADSGFDPGALDQLLGERRTMGELDELFRQMKKALMERALAAGYAPGGPKPEAQPNQRNGPPQRPCSPRTGRFAVLFGDRFLPET